MRSPAGWFVVGYSGELAPHGAVPLCYFGEPLLMFRGADGTPVVLGANEGGFDGIPYNRKVPRVAVRSWPVCERNGFILVHFHPHRDPPTWEVPMLPEHNAPEWTPYITRRFVVESDVQAMLEEQLAAHAHRDDDSRRETQSIDVAGADFRLRARTDFETPFGPVPGILEIQSHGVGFTLVRFTGAVETLLVTTVTPIDDEHVDARYAFSLKRLDDDRQTRAIESRFLDELQRQVDGDRRMHQGDAPLQPTPDLRHASTLALRGWAEQFYS